MLRLIFFIALNMTLHTKDHSEAKTQTVTQRNMTTYNKKWSTVTSHFGNATRLWQCMSGGKEKVQTRWNCVQ